MGSCISCFESEPIEPIQLSETSPLRKPKPVYTPHLTARQRRRAKQKERYQQRGPP